MGAREVTPKEVVDGRKVKFGPEEALALTAGMRWVSATMGKSVVILDPATATPDDLLAVMLGRSGTLRAPAAIIGRTLTVGFSPEVYAELLGG